MKPRFSLYLYDLARIANRAIGIGGDVEGYVWRRIAHDSKWDYKTEHRLITYATCIPLYAKTRRLI